MPYFTSSLIAVRDRMSEVGAPGATSSFLLAAFALGDLLRALDHDLAREEIAIIAELGELPILEISRNSAAAILRSIDFS